MLCRGWGIQPFPKGNPRPDFRFAQMRTTTTCCRVRLPRFRHEKKDAVLRPFFRGGGWGIRTPVGFAQTVFKSLKAFGIPYSAMLWNGIFFQKNERWTAYLLDFICFSLLYVFLQCFTLFFVFCVFRTAFCRVFVEKRQTFTKAIILFQNKNVNK